LLNALRPQVEAQAGRAPMNGFRIDLLPSDGSLGTPRLFRKGSNLWTRTKPAGSIFVVSRGEVEIIVPGHRSHETVIRVVKPGEICGLFSLCSERRAAAHTTGRATVPTEVLEIAADDFEAFLRRTPEAALAILGTTCERLSFAEERIRVLAQHSAEDRILALLLQLADRSGHSNPANPTMVRVQYTHAELARLSGMNRAHVTVVLNRLRDKDLVRYGRGSPTYINTPALRNYANSHAEAGSLNMRKDLTAYRAPPGPPD
jgi:CRP-like cAMP-binding protein